MFSYRYEAFCICIIILYMIIYRTSIHASTGYTPFFLMHFREAKLPVHVQVERVVGGSSLPQILTEPGSSLPQILTEPEHLKHIDALIMQSSGTISCQNYTEYSLCTNQTEATL